MSTTSRQPYSTDVVNRLKVELVIETDSFEDDPDQHWSALNTLIEALVTYPGSVYVSDKTEFAEKVRRTRS
jgi:hypothetical protein